MIIKTECKDCGKTYHKNIDGAERSDRDSSRDSCYACALDSLTNGCCPEEGDFNSASIISGEMSDREQRELRRELEKVDWAACHADDEEDDY